MPPPPSLSDASSIPSTFHVRTQDMENFDTFKDAADYPKVDGFKVVDACFYKMLFRPVPRPYWKQWRDEHPNVVVPPLEYIGVGYFELCLTYTVWVSTIILGFGSECARS